MDATVQVINKIFLQGAVVSLRLFHVLSYIVAKFCLMSHH